MSEALFSTPRISESCSVKKYLPFYALVSPQKSTEVHLHLKNVNFFRDTSAQSLFIYNMCWGIERKHLHSKTPGKMAAQCFSSKAPRSLPRRSEALGQRECLATAHIIEFLSLISGRNPIVTIYFKIMIQTCNGDYKKNPEDTKLPPTVFSQPSYAKIVISFNTLTKYQNFIFTLQFTDFLGPIRVSIDNSSFTYSCILAQ